MGGKEVLPRPPFSRRSLHCLKRHLPLAQSAGPPPPDHPDGADRKRPARRGVGGRARGGAASRADLAPEQPSQGEGPGAQNAAHSTDVVDHGLALSPTFRLAFSRFTSYEQPSAGFLVEPHNDGGDAMEDDVPVRELPLAAAEAAAGGAVSYERGTPVHPVNFRILHARLALQSISELVPKGEKDQPSLPSNKRMLPVD